MIRSAHSHTSCISCVAIITVSVISFISFSVRIISFLVAISRLAVGSSRSRISGLRAIPMASDALLICPPDKSRPSRSLNSVSRNRSRSAFVLSSQSDSFRTFMANATSDSMESLINISSGFWYTKDTYLESCSGFVSLMDFPFKRTSPFAGFIRPVIIFIIVDFPAPLEPIRAIFSPL